MAVEERSRRSLYDLLKEPLGMAATNALLDELPPVGADLATRDDIEALTGRLGADLTLLKAELAQQIAESRAHLSTILVGVMLGMLGLIVALVVSLATLT